MPKIKNETVLADNPNSIYAASKNIRTISLKNLDNPAEEPTLKKPQGIPDDKFAGITEKFKEMLYELNEMISNAGDIADYLTDYTFDEGGPQGAGMRGGAFSKNITSHTVPNGIGKIGHKKPRVYTTAESFKSRYPAKYSQYNYAKTGLNTNANFVGAGRRKKGGANQGEDYGDLYDVDVEDEEEDDDSLAPLSSLGTDPDPSEDPDSVNVEVDDDDAPVGSDYSYTKLAELLNKMSGLLSKLINFNKKNILKDIQKIDRSQFIDFKKEVIDLLNEMFTTFDEASVDIYRSTDTLFERGTNKSIKLGETITKRAEEVFNKLEDLKLEFDFPQYYTRSNTVRPEQGAERIREGGFIDYRGDYNGVNTSEDLRRIKEMNGGARGGVPILSSLASSYHRIPTKYLL
jgi:hypothetical protein